LFLNNYLEVRKRTSSEYDGCGAGSGVGSLGCWSSAVKLQYGVWTGGGGLVQCSRTHIPT